MIGVVTLRDLLEDDRTPSDATARQSFSPDSVRVSDALRRFKDEREQSSPRRQRAWRIDGIVTIEDLLEEIVGETTKIRSPTARTFSADRT
ncbi:hypothetical protein [Actinophytocola sp.]|uniref:hypothetical protein n=1 Tax=Actinophytocola sp. TaxID=1872138 RepID=UPI003D6A41A0